MHTNAGYVLVLTLTFRNRVKAIKSVKDALKFKYVQLFGCSYSFILKNKTYRVNYVENIKKSQQSALHDAHLNNHQSKCFELISVGKESNIFFQVEN